MLAGNWKMKVLHLGYSVKVAASLVVAMHTIVAGTYFKSLCIVVIHIQIRN